MNEALQEAIKEAYASAPSNVSTFDTLEISHPSVGGTLYIVNNRKDLQLTLETGQTKTFEAVGFRMSTPASGDNGVQELTISIDNVDRRVSDFLETAKNYSTAVQVKHRLFLSSDLTTPQTPTPLVLFLTDVQVTVFEISGKATFADVLNKRFPSKLYTRSRFPSIGN